MFFHLVLLGLLLLAELFQRGLLLLGLVLELVQVLDPDPERLRIGFTDPFDGLAGAEAHQHQHDDQEPDHVGQAVEQGIQVQHVT